MKLTTLELKVLRAMYASAEGQGHDFGFIEQCRDAVDSPRQLSGVVSSLTKKGLIIVDTDGVTTDSGHWTQFTWHGKSYESSENAVRIKKLIAKGGQS